MALFHRSLRILAGLSVALLAACVSPSDPSDPMPPIDPVPPGDPGTHVEPTLPKDKQAEVDALLAEIEAAANMTPAEFGDLYSVPFTTSLGYDPKTAEHLSLLQASPLALNDAELDKLGQNGFVISDRRKFPTFAYGYASIYVHDLPVYISADSVLYAVHRSYDRILQRVEQDALVPELRTLLKGMREKLAQGGAGSLGAEARADVDLFLAVAIGLLDGAVPTAVAGGDNKNITTLIAGAQAASGSKWTELFGVPRNIDFSQFKPRGHYTESETLGRYFRAMMWLGRIDFRFLEPDETGKLLFHRRQLEGAFALGELMDPTADERWTRIDSVIRAFVGEPDYMVAPQLAGLAADLGVTDPGQIANIDDGKIAQTILDGGYGTQQISSHFMVNGIGKGTLPLSSSFAFFGQRYVVDSHVFSNVVYDRVQSGNVKRMMPDPLDVAFAALSNDQAGMLLAPQLQKYSYAPDLHAMRILVDAHGDDYWKDNLYNRWLGSLRTLSPTGDVADPAQAGLPAVTGTEAWGRRLLNTQLASWAELRHDTILYAKQSYTAGGGCEYPDAYVDPYPELWGALAAFAEHGKALAGGLGLANAAFMEKYFDNLLDVSKTLGAMAEQERTGTPFDAEQMAFINNAVAVEDEGCGDLGVSGWYSKLFFDNMSAIEFEPTIADVHTQPTDEGGGEVGRVLHVGTGHARLFVVTTETCVGPRAYVGVASSYFEKITDDWERLNDLEWAEEIQSKSPADVPWMTDIVVR